MAYNKDWLPGRRALLLVMAKTWSLVLAIKGLEWGVPAKDLTDLDSCITTADLALMHAEGPNRSPVIIARCREAFDALETKMRYIKSRYFYSPPLIESDFTALLLKKPATTRSKMPTPEAQPTADLSCPGIHLVELSKIRPVSDRADPQSACGVRVYWGLTGKPTDRNLFRITEPPKSGWDFPYSLLTQRKRVRFNFDGESGNWVYFCLRYETASGKQGPFGPILSLAIP